MDTEDFTFPKISDNHSYGIDSPPLWNLSPQGSPNPYQEGNKRDAKDCCFESKVVSNGQMKGFSSSCVQNGKKRLEMDGEDDSMDLLWEGFNDELTSPRDSSSSSSVISSSKELVGFRCVTTLTRNNGALVQAKNRPNNMVVILKILKKLFFLNNSSQGKHRRRIL